MKAEFKIKYGNREGAKDAKFKELAVKKCNRAKRVIPSAVKSLASPFEILDNHRLFPEVSYAIKSF